jgi:hypothetical protein
MSDTDPYEDILVKAILRGFPRLDADEAVKIADGLRREQLAFGDGELRLDRNFEYSDEPLIKWLQDMGEWAERLRATIDTRVRSLRWAPEHNFLFVSRVA